MSEVSGLAKLEDLENLCTVGGDEEGELPVLDKERVSKLCQMPSLSPVPQKYNSGRIDVPKTKNYLLVAGPMVV